MRKEERVEEREDEGMKGQGKEGERESGGKRKVTQYTPIMHTLTTLLRKSGVFLACRAFRSRAYLHVHRCSSARESNSCREICTDEEEEEEEVRTQPTN